MPVSPIRISPRNWSVDPRLYYAWNCTTVELRALRSYARIYEHQYKIYSSCKLYNGNYDSKLVVVLCMYSMPKEWERRQETNQRAVDVLMSNLHLWCHVDGPPPEEELRDPSEIALLAAKECCHALNLMAEAHGTAQNELATFVEEITGAVDSLKMLTWESIRVG